MFILVIFFVSVFVFVGNILVIVVFFMFIIIRNSINYFIVNMVVFDLFFVFINWLFYVMDGMFIRRYMIDDLMVMILCKLGLYFRVVL